MGRGKLPMELIANERSRNSTFNKRKKGLKKKLDEFTTLCDVDACMIVYGPYHDGRPMELDIWPGDLTAVRRIIGKYKSKGAEEKAKRNHDLSDFFEKRKHKINDDIVKMRRANNKAKYPGWDNRIYNASIDQLMLILGSIDSKIDSARNWTDFVKENQPSMKESAPKMLGYTMGCTQMQPSPQSYPNNNVHGLYQRNMQLESNGHVQETKPLDYYIPQSYTFDQELQTRSFDMNSRTNQAMMMSDESCFRSLSSTDHLQYMTPRKASICYDSTSGLLENGMYNNYSCLGYYSPPSTHQPVQRQFMQHPIISNNASQVMMQTGPSQVNDTQVNRFL